MSSAAGGNARNAPIAMTAPRGCGNPATGIFGVLDPEAFLLHI